MAPPSLGAVVSLQVQLQAPSQARLQSITPPPPAHHQLLPPPLNPQQQQQQQQQPSRRRKGSLDLQPSSPSSSLHLYHHYQLLGGLGASSRRRHSGSCSDARLVQLSVHHATGSGHHLVLPCKRANSNSQPLIAIDSKIEQAMELVKTHLMYAVREEVDVLRGKIADLETTLVQLEDENAILRKHVPGDLLGKLQM